MKIDRRFIKQVPQKLLTKKLILEAFKNSLYMGELSYDRNELCIPDDLWDEEIVKSVFESDSRNIRLIPKNLLLKFMLLKEPKYIPFPELPEKFRKDRDVQVACLPHTHRSYVTKENFPEIRNPKFQLDAVSNDVDAVKNFVEAGIKIDWVSALKISPAAIKYLPKTEQTEEHITALVSVANPEILDMLANFINKSLITKEHALLMLGVKNEELLKIIERKLKGGTKIESPFKGTKTILVDVTPIEFKQILEEQKQSLVSDE